MSNANIPSGSQEGIEKKKKKTGRNIEHLIKEVTTGKNGGFDSYILNQVQGSVDSRNKILQEIRQSMLANFEEDEYGFEKEQINDITDGQLRGYIEKYARNLISLRKNALKRIRRYFPNADIDTRTLDDDLMQYSEGELSNILENSTSIKKYLRESLSINSEVLLLWKPKLRELFEPESIPEGDLKNRLEKAIERFDKSNVPFDLELIQDLINHYSHNTHKIEQIAKEFHVAISIFDAIRIGILSTDQVDGFVENILYKEIWNDISPEQQLQLKVEVRKDDFLKLSFDELKEINPNFSDKYGVKKFKDIFAGDMNFRFREFVENPNRPSLTTSFREFVEKIETKKTKINIYPIQELKTGSVMICRERGGRIRFLKIEKIDTELSLKNGIAGMELSFLDGITEGTIGQSKGKSILSYKSIEERLSQMDDIQIMNESDVRAQVNDGMFQDEYGNTIRDASIEEDEYSFEYLKNKLDSVDEKGKKYNIEKGMVFSAKVDITDKKGKTSKINQSFTVLEIDKENKMISFSNGQDLEQVTFYDFVKSVDADVDFRRIAILNTDADFFRALSGVVEDFPTGVHIKDGKFVPDHHDNHDNHHGGDDHGHGGHAKNPSIEYFKTGEGDGHIRLFEIGNELISFGEYDPPSGVSIDDIRQAKGVNKLSKNKEEGMYTFRTMTRAQFLVYLRKEKLKATTEDLLDPHAGYHPHDPHMHGGGIMGLFKGPSLNDVFKGFSNIMHGMEHYFEKNSKLNASRFALKVGRAFGLPPDIMAQLQADEVSGMKEIIEKIGDKLGNLNGPVARKKALHIAQLTSSSAEEISAAMLYMVKGYGHLYAEDIAYANGSESFINGFLYSLGWKGEELTKMKRDARAKYLGDLGSGSDGSDVTEEELIWGVLKIIDGGAGRDKSDPKYDPRFANAGAVVKAMGGPSGWEKSWRAEGIKNAYEKGIRQGGDVVNASGRVNKGLSAAKTFELNSLQGFMEKAAGKSPDPSIQTLPVLWALAGYSKHASTTMKQSVKSYGDSKGHTFHAYSFLRNFEDNETYTKTFIKALRDMSIEDADAAEKAINALREGPKEKPNEKPYEKAVDTIADIWKKHQGNGLHDDLQGKSTWIMKKINENDQDVIKYANRFAGIHMMNSGDRQVPDDNSWDVQYGIATSGMFGDNKGNATKEQDGKQVLSLAATLNKLSINGYEFEKNAYDRLWPVVIGQFQKLESEKDSELKKAQYKQYREDVIAHFRNRMSIRAGGKNAAIKEVMRKDYYKGLSYMGIEPGELFDDTPLRIGAENAYEQWQNGPLKHSSGGVESVESWVHQSTRNAMNGSQQNGSSIND